MKVDMESLNLELTALFQMERVLHFSEASASDLTGQLYDYLFKKRGFSSPEVSPALQDWDQESIRQALQYAQEIVVNYSLRFYDLSVLPVTFYFREKKVRRFLDGFFSRLFKEQIRRNRQDFEPTLITEEPIYYLENLIRKKSFPKVKKKLPHPQVVKLRFRSELGRFIYMDGSSEGVSRRVLLPHEF